MYNNNRSQIESWYIIKTKPKTILKNADQFEQNLIEKNDNENVRILIMNSIPCSRNRKQETIKQT